MTMPLKATERSFQSYVMKAKPGIERTIVSNATAGAEQRARIYFDAYRLRLLETLGNDFPELKKYVGDDEFERLVRNYVDAHPSTTPSIRWFGRRLPKFLRRGVYRARPELADIAEFEWARGEVFDAQDVSAATIDLIAAIAPERWPELRVSLIPASRVIQLRWNAPAICKALMHDAEPPRTASERQHWLVWRRGLDVHWRSLDGVEAKALLSMAAGAHFGMVCDDLLEFIEPVEAPMRAAAMLKSWMMDGIIATVTTDG